MLKKSSFRWKNSPSFDVDAFALGQEQWFLFAYIRSETIAKDEDFFRKLAATFEHGKVIGVGRALKLEKVSEPLPPIELEAGALSGELFALEGWMKFRLEVKDVLNPGLFLDQRQNRQTLIELVQIEAAKGALTEEHSLLNLFSYTGAFSIAAVSAGARSVTSVDVSSRYLDWEKRNFDANFGGLEITHKLICDDAREYLRRSEKRGTKYRWIVLDPPTFSRGKGKPFSVEKDFAATLESAVRCLQPGGAILASTNDSKWDSRDFRSSIEGFAREMKLRCVPGSYPREFGEHYALKSVWLAAPRANP